MIHPQDVEVMAEPIDVHIKTSPEPVTDNVSHGIPAQYLTQIHGKPFVRFIGLLQLAQQRGLTSLKADFTHISETVCIAHAVATFADGRVFEESGDSTETNVGREVKPHWRRMALVRAKARCLRDALGIELCSVEELEG
jgi:hypothetical protein